MMDAKVVWEPLQGSQTLFMCCPANSILYHGTRGPGKSDAQLMRFRMRVGQGFGPFWRGIIFDREYKNLDDLVSKSIRWFNQFNDGARFKSSQADYRWVWPTGEELLFRSIKRERDYWGYHGQEFPFIGWNELGKFPTPDLFDMMMSCNRSSYIPDWSQDDCPGELPLEIVATTNPYGPGHNWLKKRFINAAPAGKIIKKTVNVFNPRTQKQEDITKTQVHLFGTYRENKYLSPEYVAELEMITDPNKRAAWLDGSWDIVAGGMFDDVWNSKIHVIPAFDIPKTWKIDRAFDWGSSKPFSVGWYAESDGCDVKLQDGRTLRTVKGDLFRIREWYGSTGHPNQGLRLLASDVTKGILELELKWGLYGKVSKGPADSAIWDVNGQNSIAAEMAKPVTINGKRYPGIMWLRSYKASGSRKAGWSAIRKLLNGAKAEPGKPREEPGLFIFDNCVNCIELLPSLPRDEDDQDDVDTEAEDHIGDELRYRILNAKTGAKTGKTKGAR